MARARNMTSDAFATWFWSMVNRDGPTQPHMDTPCWEWTGGRFRPGYGQVHRDGRPHHAHRLAYELVHGAPATDACVCHRCDHRLCVRPDHLWLGTNAENTADKMQKGRHRVSRGEQHPMAKLGPDDVAAIRRLRAEGATGRSVAARFNVSPATVSLINNNRIWTPEA